MFFKRFLNENGKTKNTKNFDCFEKNIKKENENLIRAGAAS